MHGHTILKIWRHSLSVNGRRGTVTVLNPKHFILFMKVRARQAHFLTSILSNFLNRTSSRSQDVFIFSGQKGAISGIVWANHSRQCMSISVPLSVLKPIYSISLKCIEEIGSGVCFAVSPLKRVEFSLEWSTNQ